MNKDITLAQSGRRLDPIKRRLRSRLANDWLFDTLEAHLFYEKGKHPVYAIPRNLLNEKMLKAVPDFSGDQDGERWSLWVDDEVRDAVIRTWPTAPLDLPRLADYAVLEMEAADTWYEEDQEIVFKPRDPYRRVDIFESSRHVQIEFEGIVIADSQHPRLVIETGMPEQWYIPRLDINWSYLREVDWQSYCQYKGKARYWDIVVGDKQQKTVAWSYEEAIVEASALAGLVGFARTQAVIATFVDGIMLPQTSYSPDWHSPSLAMGQ